MRQCVSDYWIEFNRPLEGRVPYMYLDVRGYVSTGVGNLIDATRQALTAPTPAERAASLAMAGQLNWLTEPNGPPATAEQIAAAWDLVKGRMDLASRGGGAYRSLTTLCITDEEIDRFVYLRLADFERTLRARAPFAGFDDWPADAQLGLLSMAWALGPNFQFPKFQAYAAAGDWAGAATECRFNPESGTIVRRNDLDQELFGNAGRVVAESLDPDVLLLTGAGMDPAPIQNGYDLDTAEGLYAALERLGVTPDGLDDASLAAACDAARMNLGLEPTGDTELTDDARAFVRDQLATL